MELENNNHTNSRDNKSNVRAKRGRPKKQKDGHLQSQIQQQDINQHQFWFQSQEAKQIVTILASRCQILYKNVSGKSANQKKNPFWSDIQQKDSFVKFKNSRKAFVKDAQQLQNLILKKLEQYLQIELIGKKEQMNYFFFGKNNNIITSKKIKQNTIINLLKPLIHKDFKRTLVEILTLTNECESSDFYDITKHKHFVSWAFILAWQNEIRTHLRSLQLELHINNENNLTDNCKNGLIESLMEKSEYITKKKKNEILQNNIDQLIHQYDIGSKNEIDSIIDLLIKRNQKSIY